MEVLRYSKGKFFEKKEKKETTSKIIVTPFHNPVDFLKLVVVNFS